MIGLRFGKYVTVKTLGSGAMGHVYEAVEEPMGRRVAIKVLDVGPAADSLLRARFQNEARAAAEINHPGVVTIYAVEETAAGQPYLVMELLSGETLRERMKRDGSLPWRVVLGIGRQLASALYRAHQRGVVHRDVKPANIMLSPDPEAPGGVRVKLLDLGIAKLPPRDEPSLGHANTNVVTMGGVIIGTPGYMAPEQCRDGAQADGKADVYALAATLFHALTGQLVVGDPQNRPEMQLYAHLHHEPRSLARVCPTLPPGAGALWQRMLARDPEGRPTMNEVLETLRAFPDQSGAMELALRPGQTVGSYRVVRLLGVGPRGAFFSAVHQDSKNIQAIIKAPSPSQIDDPRALAALRAEAQALMTQTDPGVVKILDFGTLKSGLPYVVLEHLPLRTLRATCEFMASQRQRRGSTWLRAEQQAAALATVRQIAATLEAAPTAAAHTRALDADGLLVVPSPAHHAEPLVKVLDLGLGETLAGLAARSVSESGDVTATGGHADVTTLEGQQVAALGGLLRELLCGPAGHGAGSIASRRLRALVARMEDPQPTRRPRRSDLVAEIDQMQTATLVDPPWQRGGWQVAAAVGLLCAGAAVPLLYPTVKGLQAEGAQQRGAPLFDRTAHAATLPPAGNTPAVAQPEPVIADAPQPPPYGPPAPSAATAATAATTPAPVKPSSGHSHSSHRSRSVPAPEPKAVPMAGVSLSPSPGGALVWSTGGAATECRAAPCALPPLPAGTRLRLTAAPDPGHYFKGWAAAGCTGEDPCEVTLAEGALDVEARFGALVPLRATAQGEGDVRVEGGARCGDAPCFRPGQKARLHAVPRGIAQFRGWTHPECGLQNPCALPVPAAADVQVAATFAMPSGQLDLEVRACGRVEVHHPQLRKVLPAGDYSLTFPQGSTVQLRAAPGLDPARCAFTSFESVGHKAGGACEHGDHCEIKIGPEQRLRVHFSGHSAPGSDSTVNDGLNRVTPGQDKMRNQSYTQ